MCSGQLSSSKLHLAHGSHYSCIAKSLVPSVCCHAFDSDFLSFDKLRSISQCSHDVPKYSIKLVAGNENPSSVFVACELIFRRDQFCPFLCA